MPYAIDKSIQNISTCLVFAYPAKSDLSDIPSNRETGTVEKVANYPAIFTKKRVYENIDEVRKTGLHRSDSGTILAIDTDH